MSLAWQALAHELDHMRVDYDPETGVATLILDYPEKMNRISMLARWQIRDLFDSFDRDPQVRFVVVRGAGDQAFTAGGDIPGFLEKSALDLMRLHDNIAAPSRCSKPVIAAVDGYCFGVGFELALACDYIIATRRSTFALPEVKLGMLPGSGGSQRLTRIVGPIRAKWMMMTGRWVPAEVGEQWGFVSRVVPDSAALDQAVAELIAELRQLSPVSLALLKYAINKGEECTLEGALTIEGLAYGISRTTEDFVEGVRAFVQKRKPEFTGR